MKTFRFTAVGCVLLSMVACGERQGTPATNEPLAVVSNVTIAGGNTTVTGGDVTISSQTVINAQSPLVQPAEISSTATASSTTITITDGAGGATQATTLEQSVTPVPVPVPTDAKAVAPSTGPKVRLFARAGSKLRIEGTSNIHDWQVESAIIGGSVEVGPNFPLDPSSATGPGVVEISGEVFATVRSLKSLKPDGQPYSDMMDNIMHGKLLAQNHPKITFQVTELTLNQALTPEKAFTGTASGDLTVAGVVKPMKFPIEVHPLGEGKARISGSMNLKMTDFNIDPPAPGGMFIKTGDGVKVLFDWSVGARAPGKT